LTAVKHCINEMGIVPAAIPRYGANQDTNMSVQILLTLIILLPLMGLLVLFVIQVTNMYSDDESCTDSDSFGEPEGNPNRSRTEHDLPDDLSAGGWPPPTVADQLPSPAGEPSADRHS
jgi:hypothetical protein